MIVEYYGPREFFAEIYNSYKNDLKSIWNEIETNYFRTKKKEKMAISNDEEVEHEQESDQQLQYQSNIL